MFKGIDFFSDTVTQPTADMKAAMMNASLGDEQLGEDPTTLELESKTAKILGMDGALFFPTSTMANQSALQMLCRPGNELIAAENAHVLIAEGGGPAVHSGAMAKPIRTSSGLFSAQDVEAAFRTGYGTHYPVTEVLVVENTTNMGGGISWPLNDLKTVLKKANELRLKCHLDGSRLFNAAIRERVAPSELTRGFDTVTICLSKGLACPMGAVLGFRGLDRESIRRIKQRMGGSLRQSGLLAAAGIFALDNHVERLHEDHQNAARLAEVLSSVAPRYLRVENPVPSTNMVFFRWNHPTVKPENFWELCVKSGLRFSKVGPDRFRAVTHIDVRGESVDKASRIIQDVTQHL